MRTVTPKLQSLSQIKYLTIHCAATPAGRVHTAAEVTRWDVERFGQPSYHHVCQLDGTTVRTLLDTQIGAHVGGQNTGNIGVCYVGGLKLVGGRLMPADTRTRAQGAAMLTLIADYRRRFPGIVIRGHRDWSPDRDGDGVIEKHEWLKDCPCFDAAAWLKAHGIDAGG